MAQTGSDGKQVSDKKTGYDDAGRVVQTQVMDGQTNPITTFTYDVAGRKATVTAPPANPGATDQSGQAQTTTYSYDNDGNVTDTKVTYTPAGGTTATTVTDTTQQYDALGRPTTVWHPDNTSDQATYDAAGHLTCRAVLRPDCAATPITGGQALTYDPLGQMIAWQDAPASGPAAAQYAYDGEGTHVWMRGTSSDSSGSYSDTWVYLLGVEEVDNHAYGAANPYSAARRHYPLPGGGAEALRDGTGLHYVATDALGTPIATYNLDTGALLGA